MKRKQSASSINMYKQCPRKYYYRYILKMPDPPTIHTVRGNIVHSALEHFFKINPNEINNYEKELKKHADKLLDKFWIKNKSELKKLGMDHIELNEFYSDSRQMMNNWVARFNQKIKDTGLEFPKAFHEIKPVAEEYLESKNYYVRGYIDAIHKKGENIKIVDYKTSRKDIITPEYSLQAGIYALLVQEVKGYAPEIVAFDFLKGEEKEITVDEELIKNAKFEIENIHASTESDRMEDYPKKPSGLCKWSNERGSGQCPFYDICKPKDD
ncbi:MAG: RecB family exonuclease [Nanobdellota archaeon]